MADRPASAAILARGPFATALGRVGAALRDVAIGACGTDAYSNYLTHLRRHHPEQVPLSREAFATEDLVARWQGVRRCC